MTLKLSESPNRRVTVGEGLLKLAEVVAQRSFEPVHRCFSTAQRLILKLEACDWVLRRQRDASDEMVKQQLRHLHRRLASSGQGTAFQQVRLYSLSDFFAVSARKRSEVTALLCERLRKVRLLDDGLPYLLDALELLAAKTLVRVTAVEHVEQWLMQSREAREAVVPEWNRAAEPWRHRFEGLLSGATGPNR